MNAFEFIKLRRRLLRVIKDAETAIDIAYGAAQMEPPPKKLRRAKAKDIVVGNVIFYHPDRSHDVEPYFRIVEEVHCPDDDWKAYTADDGCLMGLHEAWVKA